jgi:hypothetical protein
MKALTISQPWASLIASGKKWIENRCWRTYYRGPLAIHAGSGKQYLDRASLAAYSTRQIVAVCDLVSCLSWGEIHTEAERNPDGMPNGIRRAWVIDPCVNDPRPEVIPSGRGRTWREIRNHEHCEGEWCWILANVRRVESDAIAGKQGLWDLPSGVVIKTQRGQ